MTGKRTTTKASRPGVAGRGLGRKQKPREATAEIIDLPTETAGQKVRGTSGGRELPQSTQPRPEAVKVEGVTQRASTSTSGEGPKPPKVPLTAVYPWLSLFSKGLEQMAEASQPGRLLPWMPAVFKGNDQITSPAPSSDGPRSDYAEGPSSIDRLLHASMGRATLGISPAAVFLAYADWSAHLAWSPGKQQLLLEKATRKATRFGVYAARAAANPRSPPCIEPLPQDWRFRGDQWQRWPFNRFIRLAKSPDGHLVNAD